MKTAKHKFSKMSVYVKAKSLIQIEGGNRGKDKK